MAKTVASRQRLPQTLSCNSCTSPYAGGCCCCCCCCVACRLCWLLQLLQVALTDLHARQQLSRLPRVARASPGNASSPQGAKRETPTFIWPTPNWWTTSRLPPPLLQLIIWSITSYPVCLSVCQFVVPLRTKPASIAFDSFDRFPQLLFMYRAWLFARGRIICLARSVHVSVCLYFCICSSDWYLLFSSCSSTITIPLTALDCH